jgi:hypothetical protein
MSAVDRTGIGPQENSFPAKLASPRPEDWSDREFREAFESLAIPNEKFHHREHIRLAWIYSSHFQEGEALSRIVLGIQAFAAHHRAAAKYHHTITVAWMRLVRHAVRSAPPFSDFITFAVAQPHLLNPRLLEKYYSAEMLGSDTARHAWMEPDLGALP